LASKLETINEKFERATEQAGANYQKAEEEYQAEYLNNIADISTGIATKISELQDVQQQLESAKHLQEAVIQIFKEQEKEKDKVKFYKLPISSQDIAEIQELREVVHKLRNAEPLNKAIWKIYFEKPFADLVGRILNNNPTTGIYKITNQLNNKSYIGQSLDVKSRLRTHIKRGLGAEASSRNKLYMAMQEDGVENFTFMLLEECTKEQLNDKEKYWIDFFKTQDFGYNVTKGGS